MGMSNSYKLSFDHAFSIFVAVLLFLALMKFGWNWGNKKRGSRKRVRYPPGPWNLPVFGYMPFLGLNPNKRLESLGKKYGSIFTIFLGRYRVVVLNDYQVIREAFKEDAFSGRPHLKMLEVRNAGIGEGLVCSEGRTWMELRKFTMKHLKDLGFGKQSMEALIQEEMNELIENVRAHLGESVDLLSNFRLAVLNSIWKITCGERYNHNDTRLLEILKKTGADLADTQYTGPILFLPWVVRIAPMITRWNDLLSSVKSVHQFLRGKIEAHKRSFNPVDLRDFIDHFLAEIESTTDKKSSFYGNKGEHSLLVTLLDLFMAGADTTSTTLYWAFLYLVLHKNAQAKVQQEIDSVIGTQSPRLSHRKGMPYTEATIKELLGYDIPKDTVVIANLHNCHHSESYWKDPQNFRPERFLENVKYDAFLPFSAGKRVCPGESLAKDELFLFIVGLLQRFTFDYSPKGQRPSETPKIGIILSPQPYSVIATIRHQDR